MTDPNVPESQGQIIVFGARQIRRAWAEGEWFFSVVDIVGALTESPNPRDYWYRMKRREKAASGVELSTFCRQLKLTSADGKAYETEAVNTESACRGTGNLWNCEAGFRATACAGGQTTRPAKPK
jgi:hypothetical protein